MGFGAVRMIYTIHLPTADAGANPRNRRNRGQPQITAGRKSVCHIKTGIASANAENNFTSENSKNLPLKRSM
jgi:hypothetical protein